MLGRPYTLGRWRPHSGREAEFIAAWLELAELFKDLHASPGDGVLLRSVEDPGLCYSVGATTREGERRA